MKMKRTMIQRTSLMRTYLHCRRRISLVFAPQVRYYSDSSATSTKKSKGIAPIAENASRTTYLIEKEEEKRSKTKH